MSNIIELKSRNICMISYIKFCVIINMYLDTIKLKYQNIEIVR